MIKNSINWRQSCTLWKITLWIQCKRLCDLFWVLCNLENSPFIIITCFSELIFSNNDQVKKRKQKRGPKPPFEISSLTLSLWQKKIIKCPLNFHIATMWLKFGGLSNLKSALCRNQRWHYSITHWRNIHFQNTQTRMAAFHWFPGTFSPFLRKREAVCVHGPVAAPAATWRVLVQRPAKANWTWWVLIEDLINRTFQTKVSVIRLLWVKRAQGNLE